MYSQTPTNGARHTSVRRLGALLLGATMVALAATGCSIINPVPRNQPPATFDMDYNPVTAAVCYNMPGSTSSTAPYPADPLTPISQVAVTQATRFNIPAPAKQEASVAGMQAHGVFVVAEIQAEYTGKANGGLTINPDLFSLVDRNGAVHCTIPSPTETLNPSIYTAPHHYGIWTSYLLPGEPMTITLVFDLDPDLVAGAYLRARDTGSYQTASLDIGLS